MVISLVKNIRRSLVLRCLNEDLSFNVAESSKDNSGAFGHESPFPGFEDIHKGTKDTPNLENDGMILPFIHEG